MQTSLERIKIPRWIAFEPQHFEGSAAKMSFAEDESIDVGLNATPPQMIRYTDHAVFERLQISISSIYT